MNYQHVKDGELSANNQAVLTTNERIDQYETNLCRLTIKPLHSRRVMMNMSHCYDNVCGLLS